MQHLQSAVQLKDDERREVTASEVLLEVPLEVLLHVPQELVLEVPLDFPLDSRLEVRIQFSIFY